MSALGERSVRIREVEGSNPFRSTKKFLISDEIRNFFSLTKNPSFRFLKAGVLWQAEAAGTSPPFSE